MPPSTLTIVVLSSGFAVALIGMAMRVFRRKSIPGRTEANHELDGLDAGLRNTEFASKAVSDKNLFEANAAFAQLREDYRHRTTSALLDLERRVELLKICSREAIGQTKTDLDARLEEIHLKRAEFDGEYGSIESVPSMMWVATTTRLGKELAALAALVARA